MHIQVLIVKKTVHFKEDMFVEKMELLILMNVLQNVMVLLMLTILLEFVPNLAIVSIHMLLFVLDQERLSETNVKQTVLEPSSFHNKLVDAIVLIIHNLFVETIKLLISILVTPVVQELVFFTLFPARKMPILEHSLILLKNSKPLLLINPEILELFSAI